MRIDVRIDGDRAVLALSSRLTRGEHFGLLHEKVNALLREGYRAFVVDLRSVSYVDNAGLDELYVVYSNIQREGAAIRVDGLNELADRAVVRAPRRGITLVFSDATTPALIETVRRSGASPSAFEEDTWWLGDDVRIHVIYDVGGLEQDMSWDAYQEYWRPLKEGLGADPIAAIEVSWGSADTRAVETLVQHILTAHRGFAGDVSELV